MPTEVRTGTVLAGFRIDSKLGEGAMGTVYLAEDTRRGGRVALKVLSRDLADNDRFRRRFLRESKLAAALDHPNVVPVLDAGEEDGVLYLAMAHVEGSDLREVLRREGRLDPERTLSLAAQVAGALDAAHRAGLVHRDVKPGNIVITDGSEGEHAYVCDFGLARHLSSASSLTTDKGIVGTIDYIPPEQIEGGTIDGRADVYSLGCVLFECLAGVRPFDRESELSVVFAHLNEPPPKLSDHRPELPYSFDGVFDIALAKSAAERYATCQGLVDAASAAVRGQATPRRRRRRRLSVLAPLALLATAGVAVGGMLVARDADPPTTISQVAIAGAGLGVTEGEFPQEWGRPGAIVQLRYPENYAKQTFDARKVNVYYDSGITEAIQDDLVGAVEITTWNKNDRTDAGVGPCSTVDELKAGYGARLKPVEANIQNGLVFGYTVGRKLFFAVDAKATPPRVSAVALHSNPLQFAGFNALGDGPCA